MITEREPKRTQDLNKTTIPGGIVFENRSGEPAVSKDGYNQGMYGEIKSRAVADIPALQDPVLLQKVEDQLSGMLGALPIDRANSLLGLAMRHRDATTSMLYGFVSTVKKGEKQNRQVR